MTTSRDLADLIHAITYDGTNIILGDSNTDALGAEAGSVTISTGNSGVSAPNTGADDLIVENSGDTGITIASPNTAECVLRFADPEEASAGSIVYDHADDSLNFYANGSRYFTIDSTGKSTFEAAVQVDSNFPTLALDDQNSTTIADTGGVVLFRDLNGNNAGRVGFPASDGVMVLENHNNAALQFETNAAIRLTIEADGTLNVSTVANYEDLVTADDDIPNKKYVDDNSGGGYQLESTTSITGSPTSVSWAIESLLSTYRQVLVIVEALSYGSASFDNVELWSDAGSGTAFLLTTINSSASTSDRDTFTFVWNKLPSNGTKSSYGVDIFWVAEDSSTTAASFIDKGYYQLDANGAHSAEIRIDGGANLAGGTIYIYGLV